MEDLETLTQKQPSADVNPANHLGLICSGSSTLGLSTGIMLGKAFFAASDNPKLEEALILNTFFYPSRVKCSFFLCISTICLNKSKSAFFCVIRGYLSK